MFGFREGMTHEQGSSIGADGVGGDPVERG